MPPIGEGRRDVFRRQRPLERPGAPQFVTARGVGKADDFVRPPLHLVADTSEEGLSLAEVDAPHFCQVVLQMWQQVVRYADQLSATGHALGGMAVGFRPWIVVRCATGNHLAQTADGLRESAPLQPHTEVDDAPAAALSVVDPQVLFGVHLEARMTVIPQRRAVHRVARQPSDGRDALTFQVRRDGVPLDGW